MIIGNTKTWLLVADASKARLYSIHKARIFQEQTHLTDGLELVSEFKHDKSRKKNSDLITDKSGEFGSGTFVEATSVKFHEAEQFAHELLKFLDVGRKEKTYRDLIIVAPPTFMGLLHKHMPHEMHKLVSQRIEKDYTNNTERELMQNLLNHF